MTDPIRRAEERCFQRACEAFIGRQGDHEFGELVAAAVALRAARHRPAAVEAWEDGPHGVGMSDKVAVSRGAVVAPEREGWGGRPTDCPSDRCGSLGTNTAGKSILTYSGMDRAQSDARTGNAIDDEAVRGITHGRGSRIVREFGRPVDPTIEAGDSA